MHYIYLFKWSNYLILGFIYLQIYFLSWIGRDTLLGNKLFLKYTKLDYIYANPEKPLINEKLSIEKLKISF